MKKLLKLTLLLLMLFISSSAFAEKLSNSISKKDLHEIIKKYLMQNPEIVEQALISLKKNRQKEKDRIISHKIKNNRKDIFLDSSNPISGNPNGKIVIVEYFDYRCAYCRSSFSVIKNVLKENKEVKIVHKELPILGKLSMLASKAALASHIQGKYEIFHSKLMKVNFKNLDKIYSLAKESGLNLSLLKKDMFSKKIEESILKIRKLAIHIGVRSTPTYVIGNNIYPGALDKKHLRLIISKLSKNK